MNENIEYKIKRLLVDFEELEKRIKANKNLLDKSSQTIKNEIEKEVQTLSSEITSCKNLVESMSTSVGQNTQDISQNTAKITEINTKIGNFSQLNEKMTQISTSIENLSQIINNLQLNDNSQLVYQDVGINEDNIFASVNSTCQNGDYYSQTYYLVCDINQYIDIDFELEFDPTSDNKYSTVNYKVELLINNETFVVGEFPLKSSSDIKTFSKRFFPTKKVNEIRVHCTGNRCSIVKYYKIKVKGKNLTIVGETASISITCFNNKYYICNKNDTNDMKLYFAELDKDNFTLDTSSYQYGQLYLTEIIEKVSIYPIYNLSTKTFSNYGTNHFGFPVLESRNKTNDCFVFSCFGGENNPYFVSSIDININAIDYDFLFTGKKPCFACFCFALSSGEAYIFASPNQSNFNRIQIKLNGENVPSVYYKCAMVKNNNVFETDSGVDFYGSIFWNITTQNWEFFETYDNTYKVILPPGKYCTAYYQTDGSINVYISRGCTTYKYTLAKNTSTNQYELSSTISTIPQCTKYDELYDNKALIACYNEYRIQL